MKTIFIVIAPSETLKLLSGDVLGKDTERSPGRTV